MMKLMIAACVGVLTVIGSVSAQDKAVWPKPLYASESMLKRNADAMLNRTGGYDLLNCAFKDGEKRAVNTTVTVEGKKYRCVQVLNGSLQPAVLGWVRMPDAQQEPAPR